MHIPKRAIHIMLFFNILSGNASMPRIDNLYCKVTDTTAHHQSIMAAYTSCEVVLTHLMHDADNDSRWLNSVVFANALSTVSTSK